LVFPALTACRDKGADAPLPITVYAMEHVEQAYRERIGDLEALFPAELIELSARLYQEIKPAELMDYPYAEVDNLLFESGTYDWHDGRGRRFELSVARQFWLPGHDEPFQLRIVVYYGPAAFNDCGSETIWSFDGHDLAAWQREIRATEGFKLAQKLTPQEVELSFYQV